MNRSFNIKSVVVIAMIALTLYGLVSLERSIESWLVDNLVQTHEVSVKE